MQSFIYLIGFATLVSSGVVHENKKRGLYDYGTLGGYGIGGGLGHLNEGIRGPLPFRGPSGSPFSLRGSFAGPPPFNRPYGIPFNEPYRPLPPGPPIHVGTDTHTTVTKQYAVPVPHPVRVPVPVPYPVEVPKPYPVPVDRPYGVPVPYPVGVPKPYPVGVPHPYPVGVPHPYPVGVPQPYPVGVPQPYPAPYLGPKPYLRSEGLGLGLGSSIIH